MTFKILLSLFLACLIGSPWSCPNPGSEIGVGFHHKQILAPKSSSTSDPKAPSRKLANDTIHNEIVLDPSAYDFAKSELLTFRDYMDQVLHNAVWGYYNQIGVGPDFRTFPMVLSPFFGQMVAEQAFRMWQGMVRARNLKKEEQFTFLELGGGTGILAHDFLTYVTNQAERSEEWEEFKFVLRYQIVERSSYLRERQTKLNKKFEPLFETLDWDARYVHMMDAIKGIVFSNELVDTFAVHKVILSPEGKAEMGYVIPAVPVHLLSLLGENHQALRLREKLRSSNNRIGEDLGLKKEGVLYLSQMDFYALLDHCSHMPDEEQRKFMEQLEFYETFIPVRKSQEVVGYLQVLLDEYSEILAQLNKSAIFYPNLDSRRFIKSAGRILQSGYVITIDYGFSLFSLAAYLKFIRGLNLLHTIRGGEKGTNPFEMPTFVDLSADVNFTLLALEGRKAGLESIFFGPQLHLEESTPLRLDFMRIDDFKAYQDRLKVDRKRAGLTKAAVDSFFNALTVLRLAKGEINEEEVKQESENFVKNVIQLIPNNIVKSFKESHFLSLIRELNLEKTRPFEEETSLKALIYILAVKAFKDTIQIAANQGANMQTLSFIEHKSYFQQLFEKELFELFKIVHRNARKKLINQFQGKTAPGFFKILVQRKEGTDPEYVFSKRTPHSLFFSEDPESKQSHSQTQLIKLRLQQSLRPPSSLGEDPALLPVFQSEWDYSI